MATSLIHTFNWVDILILIVLIRVLFIASRKGLLDETFKLLGVFVGAILSIHFFVRLGNWILVYLYVLEYKARGIALAGIFLTTLFIFRYLRIGVLSFFGFNEKEDSVGLIKGFFILIFRAVRGVLLISFLLFFFGQGGFYYLQASKNNSMLSNYISGVTPKVYELSYRYVIARFFPFEPMGLDLITEEVQ